MELVIVFIVLFLATLKVFDVPKNHIHDKMNESGSNKDLAGVFAWGCGGIVLAIFWAALTLVAFLGLWVYINDSMINH